MLTALGELAGTIDAREMRAMNKAVKIDGEAEARVAGRFVGIEPGAGGRAGGGRADLWRASSSPGMIDYTLQHLALVGVSLSLAILLAAPLGVLAVRYRRIGQVVLGLVGILQTVPSLALFVFMIPLFGIGATPVIAALLLYSLLPILTGIRLDDIGLIMPDAVPATLLALAIQGVFELVERLSTPRGLRGAPPAP